MASSPITSWQIDGKTMETITDFIFLVSKITADGDWIKAMINLESLSKSKDITLLTKVPIVKTMVFPRVMYGCESWIIKKTEYQRIDTFELVLVKTLDSPLDCKKIKPVSPNRNQSWILIGRTDAEVVAPEVDDRGRDGWKASPIQGTWRTGNPDVLQFTGSQRVEHNSTRVRKCYCLVAIMPFTWYAQGTVEKFCVYSSQVKCRVEENWSKSSL